MEIGQLGFIVAWVSIIGTTLGAIFAAFAFLHREMRRGFDRVDERFVAVDEKFDRMEAKFDDKFEGLRAEVTAVQVSVARIEGHLGIGIPAAGESRPPDRVRGTASPDPSAPPSAEVT